MAQGITVDINANLSRLSDQIDRSVDQFRRFQSSAESYSARINSALSTIGVGLSVAGLGAFIKSGIDAADAMGDFAEQTGTTVEQLAGFQFAVNQAGVDMDTIRDGLNDLSIFMVENADAAKQLGLSAKEPIEAFLQFADIFSSIDDEQARAAVGAKILSESYADMAPLLLQGSAALREQMKIGRELNPVTTEQAQRAEAFNRQLEILSARSIGLRSKIALGILEPLTDMAEAMEAATKNGITLTGVLEGIANGWRNNAFGTGGGLTAELDTLNVKIAEARQNLRDVKSAGIFGGDSAGELAAQKALNALIDDRAALMKKISEERRKDSEASTVKAPGKQAIDELLGLNAEGKKAEESAKKSAESVDRMIASLRREVALRGDSSAAAAMQYDIAHGAYQGISAQQQRQLINLAAEKDAIAENIKAWQEYDDVIAQGLELAKQQRADDAALQGRLNQKFNAPMLDLTAGMDDVANARALGIIDADRAKAEFDKLGQAYNDSFIDPALTATDSLGAYAEQAARNIQDSFADFLFDPFQDGLDGMLTGFLDIVRRMAAETAASQLLGSKKDGGLGLGEMLWDGASSLLAGLFHDGGLVGQGGGRVAVSPAVFAGAPRYHSGGLAGLAPDEVPAILQRGELVLSRKQLASGQNYDGAGGTVNYITIQVQARSGESPSETGQRVGEAFVRAIAREEIKSAARPGNQLNQVTKFG